MFSGSRARALSTLEIALSISPKHCNASPRLYHAIEKDGLIAKALSHKKIASSQIFKFLLQNIFWTKEKIISYDL